MKKLLLAALMFTTPALADIELVVSKRHQSMEVYQNGELIDVMPVSTARKGYYTPVGTYYPYSLQRMHYSKKYDNAPMPNSIFFNGGYAIHATPRVNNLGRPASHGCVRVSPSDSATLFELVRQNINETKITIK